MKRRKLKGYVLPTLYLLITISIFTGVVLLGKSAELRMPDYNYGTDALQSEVQSVIVEDTIVSSQIESPVDTNLVDVSVKFYSMNDTEENQQNSLIYYENTYLPNTGLLYASDDSFEVKTVFAGKVSEIIDDEFFGKCVVVEHTNTLRTYYYGLQDIKVNVNDELENGAILGTSKNNEIDNNKQTFLLEVYHNNKLINPEKFIGMKITDFN